MDHNTNTHTRERTNDMASMLPEQREYQLNKATKMKLVVATKGQSRQLIFYGIVSFTWRPNQTAYFEFATGEEAAECRRLTGWKNADNSTRSRVVYPAYWIEPQGSLPTEVSWSLLVDRREEMKEAVKPKEEPTFRTDWGGMADEEPKKAEPVKVEDFGTRWETQFNLEQARQIGKLEKKVQQLHSVIAEHLTMHALTGR